MFIGWSSVVGSFVDGALGLVAAWQVLAGGVAPTISLDTFLREFVEPIYWVKHLAYYVMPDDFVNWLFALPALAYFPLRILTSAIIGWWALRKAAELAAAN